jgi:chromosome segregation ATPase
MEKAGAKKSMIKNSATEQISKPASITQTEKILVENFVSLQKVLTNLSEKFTDLSAQISKLLGLFEMSAKTLSEKGVEDNSQIVSKLNSLLDQNKIIARGISLLHEQEEQMQKDYEEPQEEIPQQKPMIQQRPPMHPPQQMQRIPPMQRPPAEFPIDKETPTSMQGYQKSISSP